MNDIFYRETQIRKLPNSKKNELVNLLENDFGWRKIMSIVTIDPFNPNENELKYSTEDIKIIETVSLQERIPCSLIFLEEWQSTGLNKRPNLDILLKLSIQVQLFRLADFIAMDLLKEPPPERPLCGVAARIDTDIYIDEKNKISSKNDTFLDNLDSSYKDEQPKNIPFNTSKKFMVTKSLRVNEKDMYPNHYTYNTILTFSKNFKTELGNGGFGKVFLGQRSDGKLIAIKKLNLTDLDENHIKEELSILKKFSHPNLLNLLGYCYHQESYYLIHDYISNGSLEDALKNSSSLNLYWHHRLSIAHGTIKGLHYLHTFFEKPYVHRDIKSANILIESNFSAKICDFEGLRKSSLNSEVFTENVLGTDAYMAPEAFIGDISIKMDSYSFGVVLLELLTGLSAYDAQREENYLVGYLEEIKLADIKNFLDSRASWSEKMSIPLYKLAKNCIEIEKELRYDSADILKELEILIS